MPKKKTNTESIVDRVVERLRQKHQDEQEAARFYHALDRAIAERKTGDQE